MARNKIDQENIRSLTLMGDGRSLGLTLPIKFVRDLQLNPHQKVRVARRGQNLVIQLDSKK